MESMLDIALDILADATIDTLKLVPFLLATYIAMEWLEHKTGTKTQEAVRKAGSAGPIIGAALGVVPQCGFSAAASTLYAGRVITLGTLFAVYLSTSDEMLPIFIAEQAPVETIAGILVAKLVIAMVMGFLVDAIMRRRKSRRRGFAFTNCASATDATATIIAAPAKSIPRLYISITMIAPMAATTSITSMITVTTMMQMDGRTSFAAPLSTHLKSLFSSFLSRLRSMRLSKG